jgi:hypothetical protein
MRPRFGVCLLLGLSTATLLAEPPVVDHAVVEAPSRKIERDLTPYLTDKLELKKDVIEKKHFKISGPLVHPFKGRLRETPRRFLHIINPLASTDAEQEAGGPRASAQAWTTSVGWSSGPAGSDPAITHESRMGLVNVSR